MIDTRALSASLRKRISKSQLRSYEFLPRATAYLLDHREISGIETSISEFPDAPNTIWWVDNFGNCKTTLFEEDIAIVHGYAETKFGRLPYFKKLNDVPSCTTAIISGSSGIDNKRFLEIVVQGESAAKILNISSGDPIF